MRKILAVVFALLSGTACSPIAHVRGNLIGRDDLARLKPLQQTQEDILEILGHPSLKLDERRWLYIGQEQEVLAFLTPEVKEQRTFLVTFDAAGRYLKIEKKCLRGRHLSPDPDTTSEAGKEVTISGQIFDNLKRAAPQNKS
jgi:outer membrane protein assembly factor BamE (lipoprotein component of BamABCDE complex)